MMPAGVWLGEAPFKQLATLARDLKHGGVDNVIGSDVAPPPKDITRHV